ncbi:hypothetical protein [Elongatibacter sediminis]|uniref:Lipoprotein n=1 Tax=Elongatibacter sediminis TaxID=3119006 RepID=A0AAW9RKW2_9GAMM
MTRAVPTAAFRPAFHPVISAAIAALALLILSGCAGDGIDDRRAGQQIVCHKESKTLAVSNADSFVHLNHGDSPGPCPVDDEKDAASAD